MIDTLEIIDYDRITKIADDVITGKATIARLDPQEESGRRKGGRTNVEASLVLGGDRQTNRKEYDTLNVTDIARRQESLLKTYALHRGVWLREEDIARDKLRELPHGEESRVYLTKNGKSVIKVTNYLMASRLPENFLDNRISIHNYLFRDTKYELLGFLETGGYASNFHFVTKQPFIQGRMLSDVTNPEQSDINRQRLKSYMKNTMNFREDFGFYVNDNYVLGDLHLGNVFEDDDGLFFFIDTIPILNLQTLSFGGNRFYGDWSIVYHN